jgi:hypothetical protein
MEGYMPMNEPLMKEGISQALTVVRKQLPKAINNFLRLMEPLRKILPSPGLRLLRTGTTARHCEARSAEAIPATEPEKTWDRIR